MIGDGTAPYLVRGFCWPVNLVFPINNIVHVLCARDRAKRLRQVLVNVLSVKYYMYIEWSCRIYSRLEMNNKRKDNDLDDFITFAANGVTCSLSEAFLLEFRFINFMQNCLQ